MTIEQGELNLAPKLDPKEEWDGHTGQKWDEIAEGEKPPKEKKGFPSNEEAAELVSKLREVIKNGNGGIEPSHESIKKPIISSADAMGRWQEKEGK